MKIALHISNLAPGGAQQVMLRLTGALVQRGHAVTIMPNRASGFWQASLPEGAEVIELGARNLVAAVPRLAQALETSHAEVLLSAMTQANISAVFAARKVGVPVVISERHACSQWLLNQKRGKRFIYRHLLPFAYRRADAIVAQTRASAEDLAGVIGLPAEQIDVIGNPAPDKAPLSDTAPHPWFDGGDPVILGIGRLEKQKNFALLLEAFTRVKGPPRPRLLILGEGSQKAELVALAETLGVADRVAFTGQVADVHDYLARAALFVQSSNFEGFPNALLEALAAGTPVVATDCLTGPRELLDEGRLGELVPVGDADAMATAITRTLAHPGSSRQRKSRAADFTLDSVTERFERLLKDVCASRQPVS